MFLPFLRSPLEPVLTGSDSCGTLYNSTQSVLLQRGGGGGGGGRGRGESPYKSPYACLHQTSSFYHQASLVKSESIKFVIKGTLPLGFVWFGVKNVPKFKFNALYRP